jgi:hypothetical protein
LEIAANDVNRTSSGRSEGMTLAQETSWLAEIHNVIALLATWQAGEHGHFAMNCTACRSVARQLFLATDQPCSFQTTSTSCTFFLRFPEPASPTHAAGCRPLQAMLCKALLHSISPAAVLGASCQPKQVMINFPEQAFVQSPTAASIKTYKVLTTPPPAVADLMLTITDTGADRQDDVMQDTCTITHKPPKFVSTATAAAAWPIDDRTADLAQAWREAGLALQSMYCWEDEQIVLDIISFWQSVSGFLQGEWLPWLPEQQHAYVDGQQPPEVGSRPLTDPAQHQRNTHNSKLQQLQYVQWLWALGSEVLAVIIQLLHGFSNLTEVRPLQETPKTQEMQLLLLFMAVHDANSLSSALATHPSQAVSSFSGISAVHCLLQLGRWVPWPSSNDTSASHNIRSNLQACFILGDMVSTAMTASEAFSSACKLLQGCAAVSCAATTSNVNGRTAAPCLGSAVTVGQVLRDAYGWTAPTTYKPENRPDAVSAVACSSSSRNYGSSAQRASSSLYDSYMLELLFSMLPVSVTTDSSRHRAECSRGSGFQRPNPQSKVDASITFAAWQQWTNSTSFCALADLIISYDRPIELTRGLLALLRLEHQQQQQQPHNTAVERHSDSAVTQMATGAAADGGFDCTGVESAGKVATAHHDGNLAMRRVGAVRLDCTLDFVLRAAPRPLQQCCEQQCIIC